MNLFTRIVCLSLLLIAIGAMLYEAPTSAENTIGLNDVTIGEVVN
ncbi:MAG: hypothetical protein OEM82_09735 [Acidobacteriota bacterium]|nr:hypothetical protein [Acidobacteriota bacterium]